MSTSGPYVVTINLALTDKLRHDLEAQGFSLVESPYTLFQAKKKSLSCTLYLSGKLVVQGKEKDDFIKFYLEPEILQNFSYGYLENSHDLETHMGSDESGKGDYFGPLCIATVYASQEAIHELIKIEVKDSKKLTDKSITLFAKKIKALCEYHLIKISPSKYNELIEKFGNLNALLAWAHATAIEALYKKTSCSKVIVDQFAHEAVLKKALKLKQLPDKLEVIQRTKAESDPVVAAASILARSCFVEEMKLLSTLAKVTLPKGASKECISVGKTLVKECGKDFLFQVAKVHFKTTDAILGPGLKL